jgi:hypothetical protein
VTTFKHNKSIQSYITLNFVSLSNQYSSTELRMGLMPSLCCQNKKIQRRLNSLFPLFVASYFSAIFMKYLVTAVMIGHLAYGTFQHKLVFFGVAKIGPKNRLPDHVDPTLYINTCLSHRLTICVLIFSFSLIGNSPTQYENTWCPTLWSANTCCFT